MTINEQLLAQTRRQFFSRGVHAAGLAALSTLLSQDAIAENAAANPGLAGFPNLPVKAKRMISLFQSGAPSQLDLFDYKPGLADLRGSELPDSIRQGQRLTGMTSTQSSFPLAPTKFRFAQQGASGAWVSLSLGQSVLQSLHVGQQQFCFDHFNIVQWVDATTHVSDIVINKAAHDLQNGVDFTDVAEKLIAQTFTHAGAFDDARNIHQLQNRRNDFLRRNVFRDALQARVRNADNAFVRFDSAKRIVRALCSSRTGQSIKQSALADIRQADDSGFHGRFSRLS